jgi:hypothetical protein
LNILALLWLASGIDPTVTRADYDRFPAGEANQQAAHCREHLERLHALRRNTGWRQGVWDDALAETRQRLDYWELLCEAEPGAWLLGETWTCRVLQRLKERIGPEKYLAGWSPERIPKFPIMPACGLASAEDANPQVGGKP